MHQWFRLLLLQLCYCYRHPLLRLVLLMQLMQLLQLLLLLQLLRLHRRFVLLVAPRSPPLSL
jgi:hypothetical protein